jgi:ABC-type nitrate/sulfonate/bicarbonate transport system permease component
MKHNTRRPSARGRSFQHSWFQGMRRALSSRVALMRLLTLAPLLLFWEAAARWWVHPQFLSPPSRVLLAMPSLFATEGVTAALRLVFWELAVAFAISVLIGLAVGLPIGLSRLSRRTFMPIVLLLYGMPQITVLPLFVLYFGIGPASKIAFGVSHGVFAVIVTVIAGVQGTSPVLMLAARSMGARHWQVFRWVILPHMIPSFFAGMRLGMAGVLLGVLLAELYVSTAGVGHFTQMFTESFDPSRLLALIVVLAAMAVAFNELLRRAETHFSRWRAG